MRQRFVLDTAITDSGLRVKEGWQGMLDSSPDLDVLLLAKELEGMSA